MADSVREVEIDDIQSADDLLQRLMELETANMTEEQLRLRSLALFPTTHTTEIEVMGVKRVLRPLPIKYAKMINASLHTVSKKINEAITAETAVVIDEQMLEALKRGVEILCEFYDWKDIKADLAEEAQLTTYDLQLICNTQQRIQGTNDFLLSGLRLVLKMMQLSETLAVKQGMGKQITSNTPRS